MNVKLYFTPQTGNVPYIAVHVNRQIPLFSVWNNIETIQIERNNETNANKLFKNQILGAFSKSKIILINVLI